MGGRKNGFLSTSAHRTLYAQSREAYRASQREQDRVCTINDAKDACLCARRHFQHRASRSFRPSFRASCRQSHKPTWVITAFHHGRTFDTVTECKADILSDRRDNPICGTFQTFATVGSMVDFVIRLGRWTSKQRVNRSVVVS